MLFKTVIHISFSFSKNLSTDIKEFQFVKKKIIFRNVVVVCRNSGVGSNPKGLYATAEVKPLELYTKISSCKHGLNRILKHQQILNKRLQKFNFEDEKANMFASCSILKHPHSFIPFPNLI